MFDGHPDYLDYFEIYLRYFRSLVLNSNRNITKRSSGYEGAGKTTAQILNIEEDNGILIDGYSKVHGHFLNDLGYLQKN